MLATYSETLADAKGNVIAGAAITVYVMPVSGDVDDADTAAEIFLTRDSGTPLSTSAFFTGTRGELEFVAESDADYVLAISAPGYQAYRKAIYLPGGGDIGTSDVELYTIFSPDSYAGTIDERLAAATAAAELVGGAIRLRAHTYILSEPWIVPNNVDVYGVHPTRTVFSPDEDFCGPVIVSWPSYEDPKHAFRNIGMKGLLVGVDKTTGTVTKDSFDVTGIPANDMDLFAIGDKVDGMGLDDDTFVTAVDVPGQKITCTNDGKFYREDVLVATDTQITRREGYVFTGSIGSLTGNAVVTITGGASNLALVKKWMFATGNNLDLDGEDLSSNNRVMSIDIPGLTVTLDRPAKILGSFTFRVWREVGGWLAPETEFYNPLLTGNKVARAMTLDNCSAEGMGGTGCLIRPKRDQFYAANGTRMAANYGFGYSITASNDSQIDAKSGGGSNQKSAFKLSSSATFRWGGGECWDTKLVHLYADGAVRGCRQFTASMGDVNGRWYIKGKGTDEPNHGIRIVGWNWKWHSGSSWPDGHADAFLIVESAQVTLVDPYFYGDREDDNCPDYLIKASDGATVTIIGGRVIDDPLVAERPYKVGRFDVDGTSAVVGFITNAGKSMTEPLGGLLGVTDHSNPAAGAIGECIENTVNPGSAISLTSGATSTLIAQAGKTGDWIQSAEAFFVCTAATITKIEAAMLTGGGITVSGKGYAVDWPTNAAGFSGTLMLVVGRHRNNLAADATQNVNVRATFTPALSVTAYGHAVMTRSR